MKNKCIIYSMVIAGMAVLSSCNNQTDGFDNPGELKLQVSTGTPLARAMVQGSYLPEESKIGVVLANSSSGNDYDGISANFNVPYVAVGTGTAQTWSCTQEWVPSLSTTRGKIMAYYPYDESMTDITAMNVEALSQTDYMYATWQDGLYCNNNVANLQMQHALAVVRVKLACTESSIPAQITSVQAVGTVLGTHGIINAGTGVYSSVIGLQDGVTQTVDFTIGTTPVQTDLLVVPNETATAGADLTIKVVADGRLFTYYIDTDGPLRQGQVYTYSLTMDIN